MLYNGRRFEQALVQEIKFADRYGDGGGAMLLLDVDHFKAVNDRFGHKIGDDLLKTVAATLRGRMRDTDVLGRLGIQPHSPQRFRLADGSTIERDPGWRHSTMGESQG